MVPPTRRRVLASLAGLGALAGCSARDADGPAASATDGRPATATPTPRPTSTRRPTPTDSPRPTDSPTPTDTETPTDTPVPASALDLEFVVTVVRQPTDAAPGRVRASLTNHNDATFEFSGGDPLPVGYDTLDARPVDASASLALFPPESDRVNSYQFHESNEPAAVDDAVYDCCWKLPDSVISTVAGMAVAVSPDASVTADYFPLGYDGDGCPAGTYEAHGEMFARPNGGLAVGKVRTTMRVQVARSGSLAASGSLRVEEV